MDNNKRVYVKKQSVEYRGNFYDSVASLIDKLNLNSYDKIYKYQHYHKQLTISEAIDKAVLCKVNDISTKRYFTIKELYDDLNLSDSTLVDYLISIPEHEDLFNINTDKLIAIETTCTNVPKKYLNKIAILYKDVLYSNLQDLLTKFKLKASSVYKRYEAGFTLEESIDQSIKASEKHLASIGNKILYKGIEYKDIETALSVLNIPTSVYEKYLSLGLSKIDSIDRSIKELEESDTKNATNSNIVENKTPAKEKVKNKKRQRQSYSYPVCYNGVTYPSIAKACNELDISVASVRVFMLKKHLSFEEAIDRALKSRRVVFYRGRRFASISMLVKELRMTRHSIDYYTHKGLSIHEAIDKVILRKMNLEYNLQYSSIQSLKDHFHVDDEGLLKMVSNVNPKSSLKNIDIKKSKQVVYKGATYTSLSVLCDLLGYNVQSVKKCLATSSSLEEAFSKLDKSAAVARRLTYNGKNYADLTDLCRDLKITVETLRKLIKSGYSLEDAIDHWFLNQPQQEYSYNGKQYSNKKQMLDSLGIPRERFEYYKKKLEISDTDAIDYLLTEGKHKHKKKSIVFRNERFDTHTDLYKRYLVGRNEIHRFTTKCNLSFVDAMYRAIRNKIIYLIKHNTTDINTIVSTYNILDDEVKSSILTNDDPNSIADTIVEYLKTHDAV